MSPVLPEPRLLPLADTSAGPGVAHISAMPVRLTPGQAEKM